MKAVFADTFYWAALTNIVDPAHPRALELSRSFQPERIVTTDEVLSEYLTFFASAKPAIRDWASKNVAGLIDRSGVRIIPQSRDSFLDGLTLYSARPDKGYNPTNCVSMQTMRAKASRKPLRTTGILNRKDSEPFLGIPEQARTSAPTTALFTPENVKIWHIHAKLDRAEPC